MISSLVTSLSGSETKTIIVPRPAVEIVVILLLLYKSDNEVCSISASFEIKNTSLSSGAVPRSSGCLHPPKVKKCIFCLPDL